MKKAAVYLGLSLAVLAVMGEGAFAATLTRGPYLQIGTPTSVILRWRTKEETDSRVKFGASLADLSQTVDDAALTKDHEIKLTGLTPNARYFYSVGSTTETLAGEAAGFEFTTSPSVGEAKATRIWAVGDSGTANNNARAVRDAFYKFTGDRATDVFLMLGDNAYSAGRDSEYQRAVFQNMFEDLLKKTSVWPTRGNHDALYKGENNDYYEIFSLPSNGEAGGLASGTEAYYSFDYGRIHFICLDSEMSKGSSNNGDPIIQEELTAMLEWLKSDLASTRQDWIIAYWHHPPYTKGSHDSDNDNDSGGRLKAMREKALPILEAGGVDLVLTGHSHSYERSYLIDGHYDKSKTFTAAMKKGDGKGRVDEDGAYVKPTLGPAAHEGAVYIVAGSSGQTSGGSLKHPAMVVSFNVLGSMVVDVDGNRLDATFLDNKGAARDHFTILKGVAQEDLDADGQVALSDAVVLLRSALGIRPLSEPQKAALDLNADGQLDLVDVRLFLQKIIFR